MAGAWRVNRTHVSKAVPLGPALGIQCIKIVVGDAWMQDLDLMLEDFAAEGRDLGNVQWQAGRNFISIREVQKSVHRTRYPSKA